MTAVGDAANRASKLQSLATSNEIYIGENIFNNLHPALHNHAIEMRHKDWKWTYPITAEPYRFFNFDANFPEPKEWIKIKLK